MTPLFTVTETVAVLADVGVTLTPRQVRYSGLQPAHWTDGPNGARFFDPVDVTVLAVFADLLERCRTWGLPAWSARAAIRYRDAELRRAITRRSPRYLIVDAVRGTAALSETHDGGAHAIDLRALAAKVQTAATRYRRAAPDVWNGTAFEPWKALSACLSS
jgi:hypothetical protein